ncbi:MAG: hypothetical protein IKQ95_03425 [Synergistaceae bacterium]|nr:hypothetical protein [Synergistaceae bacterium]
MPFLRAALLKKKLQPETERAKFIPPVIEEQTEPEEEFTPVQIEDLHRLIDLRTREAEEVVLVVPDFVPEPEIITVDAGSVLEIEPEEEEFTPPESDSLPELEELETEIQRIESELAPETEALQEDLPPEIFATTETDTQEVTQPEIVSTTETVTQEAQPEIVSTPETVTQEVPPEIISTPETVTQEVSPEFSTPESVTQEVPPEILTPETVTQEVTQPEIVSTPETVTQEVPSEIVSTPDTDSQEAISSADDDFDENDLLNAASETDIPPEIEPSETEPETESDSENATTSTKDYSGSQLNYDFTSGERYVDKVSTKTEFDKMLDELAAISKELLSWQADKFARDYTGKFSEGESSQAEARKYEAFLGGYITNAAMMLYDKGYRDAAIKQLEQAISILQARKKLEDETSAIKSRVEEQNDSVDLSDILGLFGDG